MDVQDDGDDEEGEDGEGAAEDGDEPEDDFNEAWMVLDLARTLYEKQMVDEPEKEQVIKKSLGDCRMLLGDVSLETGEV